MRRPRGAPVVICDCTKPHGWPLAVRQVGQVKEGMRASGLEWIAANTRASYYDADSKVRLTGHCPQCNRFFDIRAAAEYGGDVGMDFLVALDEWPSSIQVITAHISIQDTNQPKGHIASVGYRYSEPQWVKEVPSRYETYSLWANSEVKFEFINLVNLLLENGMNQQLLPEWRPEASAEQWAGWLEELQATAENSKAEERQRRGLPQPTIPALLIETRTALREKYRDNPEGLEQELRKVIMAVTEPDE